MENIKKVSRKFRILFEFLFYLVPLLLLGFWLVFHSRYDIFTHVGIGSNLLLNKITVNYLTRILGFIASMIPIGIMMYCLYLLEALFKNYEKGRVFILENVDCYRKLSYALFAWVIGGLIYDALITFILTFQNPPHQRMVAITISNFDLVALTTAGIVLLISWVMKEGHKISEEQTLTI